VLAQDRMDLLDGPLEEQLAPDGQSPIVTVILRWKIASRAGRALCWKIFIVKHI